MKRALVPAPRTMSADERVAERRFVWKVLIATVGLHLVGGGVLALTVVSRGARPRPRLGGVPPAPVQNLQAPFDPKAPLR